MRAPLQTMSSLTSIVLVVAALVCGSFAQTGPTQAQIQQALELGNITGNIAGMEDAIGGSTLALGGAILAIGGFELALGGAAIATGQTVDAIVTGLNNVIALYATYDNFPPGTVSVIESLIPILIATSVTIDGAGLTLQASGNATQAIGTAIQSVGSGVQTAGSETASQGSALGYN